MEIQDEFSSSPHTVKPPLREVQSVTSWVCYMASYLAVLASAEQLKPEHLAYRRLVVTEATKYKGEGWRTYDATFHQNIVTGAPGLSWSNIDAGLHAISFQAARGPPLCCPMCSESDHTPQDCALQATSSVRPRAFQSRPPRSFGALSRLAAGSLCQPYSQICFSWNNGECVRYPSPCRYEHICSRCARGGTHQLHKAVDCRSPLSRATAGHHEEVNLALYLGQGALMAKTDLRSAYRRVPVYPDDQRLLGVCWDSHTWLDTALPFGLRSAPKLFSAVADALVWALYLEGVTHQLHYLDDFLLVGPPGSTACQASLNIALAVCDRFGLSVAPAKIAGPTTRLTFLGICIDTTLQQLELPSDKLRRLQGMSCSWLQQKVCTKRELLSFLGHLHHAATVVHPGRIFTRSLINASKTIKHLHYYIRLNEMMRADIAWWAEFLP